MTPDQWIAILSQLGIGGAAVLILGRVMLTMFERLIATIDALREAATTDARAAAAAAGQVVTALSAVAERLAALEARIDTHAHLLRDLDDRTSVESMRPQRSEAGRHEYQISRPSSRGKDDR